MEPAAALDVLRQVAEKYLGTLADHQLLQEALSTLGDLIAASAERLPDSVDDGGPKGGGVCGGQV